MSLSMGNLSFGQASFGHSGSAPSPFDAINGGRLAGGEGSHPLHEVAAADLVRTGDGPIGGTFTLDRPVVVGETITGSLGLQANAAIDARGAVLRLAGLRLDEVRESLEHRDGKGNVTYAENWVECHGRLFSEDPFPEPAIPAQLAAGATFEARFAIPAPPLGPPSAHLGESIVAWALEVRWDVAHGSDHFVAIDLPVAQHPDLLRAGVGKQGGESLLDEVSVGDAVIGVTSPLPAKAGEEIVVDVRWPSAPKGNGARVELHRRTNAPNGVEGIIASLPIDPAALSGGTHGLRLVVPADCAPSFDGAGLEIDYIVRVLIDRRFMPDTAIERPVAIY
jgi:hypothetical protein